MYRIIQLYMNTLKLVSYRNIHMYVYVHVQVDMNIFKYTHSEQLLTMVNIRDLPSAM